eukprot:Ihof_evm3s677 gene=Ihof_evmTU3s677
MTGKDLLPTHHNPSALNDSQKNISSQRELSEKNKDKEIGESRRDNHEEAEVNWSMNSEEQTSQREDTLPQHMQPIYMAKLYPALAASRNLEVVQLDIIGAYINGKLEEISIYISWNSLNHSDFPHGLRKFQRSLHRLKQFELVWQSTLAAFLVEQQLFLSNKDLCLLVSHGTPYLLAIRVSMDDILIVSDNNAAIIRLIDGIKEGYIKEILRSYMMEEVSEPCPQYFPMVSDLDKDTASTP